LSIRHSVPATSEGLTAAVLARFVAVNGEHAMTPADDAYVTCNFISLDELCHARGKLPNEIRARILADELPLPGYVRSDGAHMIPHDYFDLADQAGGIEKLHGWFVAHWIDQRHAAAEWRAYLDGQYICLRTVTPENMQRKDQLSAGIKALLDDPEENFTEWLIRLHMLVDELDDLTREFTGYDRLRFGGPVSRDILIDEVREKYPRGASASPSA
jgi:Family of unknown function (DUF6058)